MEQKLKGIDISEFNGKINFKKLKEQIDFVYIRATFGRFGVDKKFKEYTKEAIENNIPLCIDMEDSDGYKAKNGNPNKEMLTNIIVKACEKISENKFIPIIYACDDWFKNRLDSEKLEPYLKWIAFWNTKEENIDKRKYCIWQYSSKGCLAGIESKNVDLDYSFVNFVKIKEYTDNVSKMNLIKSKTLFSDIVLQYMSCYKWRK